ncbi:MAG: 50S ribosomal protein L24 [Nitrosomonas sp.]|nr:50S ribosomal protein L24 [Nitrosomonas sp.]MDP1951356.1 50S ribosomal protein L24 [Nitrosomonas sp.]
MRKIKKGDDVIIITGKDKGKHSSVTKLIGSDKLIVQGMNKVKKHQKPNPGNGTSGGIVEIEKALHISNVAIYNFSTKRADRVGFKFDEMKGKMRVFKSTGEFIDS